MCTQKENIYKGDTSCYDWYSAWYNSDVHRAAMTDEYTVKGACAFYEVNGYYYVVYVAADRAPTQEEWNQKIEQGLQDGSMTQYTNEETGVTHIIGEGGGAPVTDPEIIEKLNATLREAGLIP